MDERLEVSSDTIISAWRERCIKLTDEVVNLEVVISVLQEENNKLKGLLIGEQEDA